MHENAIAATTSPARELTALELPQTPVAEPKNRTLAVRPCSALPPLYA